MEGLLMQLWNLSIQAGLIICIVLAVRLAFSIGKVPKRFSYALWAIPFLRMLLPWQLESEFGMMPERAFAVGSNTIQRAVGYVSQMGETAGRQAAEGNGAVAAEAGKGTLMQSFVWLAGAVWLIGILLLFAYSVVSYWKLKKRLVCSVRMEENIFLADEITTPFVLGLFRPRIYLPSDILEDEIIYVAAHEQTHIRRGDHIIKLAAFFLTCIYWFFPLAWLAFYLMGKDMEMSCDEAVMKQFGEDRRSEYASVLLALTGGRGRIMGVPLAFSEGNTKKRIVNIMKYKKPILLGTVAGVVALVVLAASLLTSPKAECLLTELREELVEIPAADEFDHVEVYHDGVNTAFPQEYNEIFIEYLSRMKVKRQPLSPDGSGDRPQDIQITFSDSSRCLYLDAACSEIWCENGTESSLSYQLVVEKEELFGKFLEGQLESVKVKTVQELQEDVYVQLEAEKRNAEVKMEQERRKEADALQEAEKRKVENEKELSKEDDLVSEQPWRSDLYGMSVEQETLTASGATIHISNQSGQKITCSDDFHLARLEGNDWVDVPYVIDNWGFYEPAYIIEKDGLSMQVDWEWLYGKLSAGTYLITKTISVSEKNGAYSQIELGTMFELEK